MEAIELDKIKQDVSKTLDLVGLSNEVSLAEIEKELSCVNTAFESLLLLGILNRIIHSKNDNDKAAKLFIPAVTNWKNHLPHPELDGLSPAEHIAKYPPGPYEIRFLSELMNEYQKILEEIPHPENDSFDVNSHLEKFQNEYFNRIPSEQPFATNKQQFKTIREIIIEERCQNNYPEGKRNDMGVKIFAENTAEGAGQKMAEIEDIYFNDVSELSNMQANPKLRDRKRTSVIREHLSHHESYHRCSYEAHKFYLNYASAVFLDGDDIELALTLLERALKYKPDYKYARNMIDLLKSF